jgi:ligand-binding sensor domain-containing protein
VLSLSLERKRAISSIYTLMKINYLLLICLLSLLLPQSSNAQNLFTEKVDIRHTNNFCVDCGTPKATCDAFALEYIADRINRRYVINQGNLTVAFQILVDSTGFASVLSHTDVTHSALTDDLIRLLNGCIWIPAIEKGKPVSASVNVIFKIANGKISGAMQRLDLSELKGPGNPTVYNHDYNYANPSLNNYEWAVFTKYNSPMPDNVGQACIVDKEDILWYATASGLTRYNGLTLQNVNEYNSPLNSTTNVSTIASDKDNNIWMYANRSLYMFNTKGWQMFDSTHFSISGAYHIITTPTGEILFPNHKGLLILKGDKIRMVDKELIPQLPSNDVHYAFYDSQKRLWVGTADGSIMIDKKQQVTEYNRFDVPLKNICISAMTEDEQGNLYFSLYNPKKSVGDWEEEGLAVLTTDGKWYHYNDKNSGMPVNRINTLWYDKFSKALWIGTQQAGLVRFDLKDGWEVFHNTNSVMPGFDVRAIAQDSRGIIYAATANGMVRLIKK